MIKNNLSERYLCRGKRVDNNEWIEGYYVHYDDIIDNHNDDCDYIIEKHNGGNFVFHEVVPETVGQYTGLTDKNGKKIFEGDIITATTLDTGDEQRAVVYFGNFIDANNADEYIGFFIEFDRIKTTITQLSMEECKNRIEIIGNIHDNPELLQEGKQ